MPATETDYSKIRKYQEEASSLNREGSGVEAAAGTLGDRVMEAVRADRLKRGTSKLATDVGNVMGQMVTDPTGIRERTSGMVDPFSVNALTSDARAQNLRTLGTTATQGQMNQGSIDEVIQAGANRLKAQAASLYAQAQQKESEANSLTQQWEREFKEKQFAADEAYRNKSSGGAGSKGEGTIPGTKLSWADFYDDATTMKENGFSGEALVTALMDMYPTLNAVEIRSKVGVPNPTFSPQYSGSSPTSSAVFPGQKGWDINNTLLGKGISALNNLNNSIFSSNGVLGKLAKKK